MTDLTLIKEAENADDGTKSVDCPSNGVAQNTAIKPINEIDFECPMCVVPKIFRSRQAGLRESFIKLRLPAKQMLRSILRSIYSQATIDSIQHRRAIFTRSNLWLWLSQRASVFGFRCNSYFAMLTVAANFMYFQPNKPTAKANCDLKTSAIAVSGKTTTAKRSFFTYSMIHYVTRDPFVTTGISHIC